MWENNNLQLGKVEMFNGVNYHIWATKISAILRAKKLFRPIIIEEEPKIETDINSTEGKLRQIWEEKNDEAFSIIILSLSPSQAGMFLEEINAKKVWEKLENMYAGSKEDLIINSLLELKELQMTSTESVDTYMTRAQNIISKINALGGTVSQKELVFYVVRGIHQKLENIAVVLRTKRDTNLNEIHQILKEEEARKFRQKETTLSERNEMALKSREKFHTKGNITRRIECYICKKQGHKARECWHRKDADAKKANWGKFKNKYNAKTAEEAELDQALSSKELYHEYEEVDNMERHETRKTSWNLDSGCSIHMTSNKDNLINVESYHSKINMAETGRTIEAEAKGEMKMKVKVGGEEIKLRMKNVLYVPKLKDNLMSVKELIKRGNEVKFDKSGATIYGRKGRIIAKAVEQDGMFIVKGVSLNEGEKNANEKAYRVYIPSEYKIEESRSVKFDENKRGIDHVKIPEFKGTNIEDIKYITEDRGENHSEGNVEDDVVIMGRGRQETERNEEEEHDENEIEIEREQEQVNIPIGKTRGRPTGTKKGIVQERDRQLNIEAEREQQERGVRRSSRIRENKECQLVKEVNRVTIPKSYKEAMESKDIHKWKEAMDEEMKSLSEHDVWSVVEKNNRMKILRSKWVFSVKQDENGKIIRYKARLVVMGNKQEKGVDYDESYSPVIKMESLRLIVALAAKYKLEIRRYDVKTAYLHGELEEETYMQIPEGLDTDPMKVCKIKKSLYGLPQSGRRWNIKLNEILTNVGMQRLDCDPSIYLMRKDEEFIIMGIYVDDCIVIGTNDQWIDTVINKIKKSLKMREEVGDGIFLGMEIKRTENGYKICQQNQIQKLLEKTSMTDCKPVGTPMDLNQKLEIYGESKKVEPGIYQELIGSLSHISNGTRPDITFAVNKLAQFNKEPREMHLNAVKRVIRYLKGTKEQELHYNVGFGQLEAFSDASWCSTSDSRSHSGYCLCLGGSLITWKSRKQELVALSTCESEINAICETVKEINWIDNLLSELGMSEWIEKPIKIYTDSKSAIDWSNNLYVKQRTKHFDRKLYKLRDEIEKGKIKLIHKAGKELEADILTKGSTMEKLIQVKKSLCLI